MKYQFEHFKSADYIKKETGVDFSFPAHLHQSFELIIIRSGSMTVEVDSKKSELSNPRSIGQLRQNWCRPLPKSSSKPHFTVRTARKLN